MDILENKYDEISDGVIKKDNYIFWYKAEVIIPHVYKYLKTIFPDSLIIEEFNNIDFIVMNKNLPVEIQTSPISKNGKYVGLLHSEFENFIRKQIEDNIENYERCWFFFDAEYYRYLNELTNSGCISLNMDWFAKYVKNETLKVFIIKYDGFVTELKYEDLSFIRKLSSTCKIEYDTDERILNRNKIKILNKVLEGYKYTQDEINEFRKKFDLREKDKTNYKLSSFLMKEKNERMILYGHLLESFGKLNEINILLDSGINNLCGKGKFYGCYLGVFKDTGYSSVQFIDKFNICHYFPGYVRNEKLWNQIKEGYFTAQQLKEIFLPYRDKKQSMLNF